MEEDQKTLEQLLAEVFSDKFRRDTALFILPPVTAGAIGIAAGCAGLAAYGDYACDPLKHQRHDQHVEQSTSTGSLSFSTEFATLIWPGRSS
jgi:hypothetical protein